MGAMLQGLSQAGYPGVFDHPTMKFARMLDWMLEEHAELRGQLRLLAAHAAEIQSGAVPDDGIGGIMSRLAEGVRTFLERFARLARNEEDILFPTVKLYAATDMTSREEKAAILERATGQFRSFLDLADQCVAPFNREKAGQAAGSLLEACSSLKQLFVEEANTIYPLAEEIIEDMEYLSC